MKINPTSRWARILMPIQNLFSRLSKDKTSNSITRSRTATPIPSYSPGNKLLVNILEILSNVNYDYARSISIISKHLGITSFPSKEDLGNPNDGYRFMQLRLGLRTELNIKASALFNRYNLLSNELVTTSNSLVTVIYKEPNENDRRHEDEAKTLIKESLVSATTSVHEDAIITGIDSRRAMEVAKSSLLEERLANEELLQSYEDAKARLYKSRILSEAKNYSLGKAKEIPEKIRSNVRKTQRMVNTAMKFKNGQS